MWRRNSRSFFIATAIWLAYELCVAAKGSCKTASAADQADPASNGLDSIRMLRAIVPGILAVALTAAAAAQDTQYPARGQQIPAPDCMNLHFAWENVLQPTCNPGTHERWLLDLEHWRAERLHPHRLRSVALRDARARMDAVELHPAANDGARSLLLRSRCRAATPWIAIWTI